MRIMALAAAFVILGAAPAHPQQKRPRTNPATKCGDESLWRNDNSFSEFYSKAVYDNFEPPDWKKASIRITVDGEASLKLWTNGEQFKLWTYTTKPRNINKYLDDLSDSCRLPGSPAEVAALVKIKWESADLSSEQFAQIHRNLIQALSQYVSSAQQRYKALTPMIYLDAIGFRVKYDNPIEDINVEVVEDPKQYKPILDWIHDLQKLAEVKFHRPFGLINRE